MVTAALPNVNPLFTSIGMIMAEGLPPEVSIKGTRRRFFQNGLTITGAVKLSDYAMALISSIMGGSAVATSESGDSDNSVIY